MALSYGFFNAKLDSSSGEYDRTYDAEQFAEYFSLIVSNGVFPTPATQLQVVATSPTSMKVNVSAGYGWINGYYCKNDGDYPLTISAANGSLNRIDAIVLRWVNSSRSMELAVLTGTAAASPKAPTLTQTTETYELMLATVTVAKGVTSISQSAITDKRSDSSVCGWVTGAVESIDTTNLFAQYDTAFQEWFSNVQAQLSGNVATNLQNQINQNYINTLGSDTKTEMGLPALATPDDAFSLLNSKVSPEFIAYGVSGIESTIDSQGDGYTLIAETDKILVFLNATTGYLSSITADTPYNSKFIVVRKSDGKISVVDGKTSSTSVCYIDAKFDSVNNLLVEFLYKSSTRVTNTYHIWNIGSDGESLVYVKSLDVASSNGYRLCLFSGKIITSIYYSKNYNQVAILDIATGANISTGNTDCNPYGWYADILNQNTAYYYWIYTMDLMTGTYSYTQLSGSHFASSVSIVCVYGEKVYFKRSDSSYKGLFVLDMATNEITDLYTYTDAVFNFFYSSYGFITDADYLRCICDETLVEIDLSTATITKEVPLSPYVDYRVLDGTELGEFSIYATTLLEDYCLVHYRSRVILTSSTSVYAHLVRTAVINVDTLTSVTLLNNTTCVINPDDPKFLLDVTNPCTVYKSYKKGYMKAGDD
jgi:hypothetical protein